MLRALAPRRTLAPILLAVLLAAALLLQGYRYPFQINSSETSPTYVDTPTWLQLGKWGVVAVLALALLCTQVRGIRDAVVALSRLQWVLIGLQTVVLGVSVSLVARRVPTTEPATMALIAIVGITVTVISTRGRVDGRLLVTALVVYAVVALIVDAVQVALYLTVDRLPALAYYGSPSVRFGSILDDPNGFAVLLAGLVAVSWFGLRARPNARLVVVVGLLCCLPLTQSWTGSATAVVALVLVWALLRGVRHDLRRAGAVALVACAAVGTGAFFARGTIADLVRLKQGSIQAHAQSLDHIDPVTAPSAATATSAPGAQPPAAVPSASANAEPPAAAVPQHSTALVPTVAPGAPQHHAAAPLWTFHIESGYVNMLVNYGALLLVAYLVLGVLAVWLLLRRDSGLPLALRAGGAAYLVSYLLACANLGLDRTFPCNLLFFVFCGLSAYRPADADGIKDGLIAGVLRRRSTRLRRRAQGAVGPTAGAVGRA